MGLSLIFNAIPTPQWALLVCHVSDKGFRTGVDVDVLDSHGLLTLAPFPRQGFDLHGVGAHKSGCQVAEYVQSFDAVTLVDVACDSATSTGDQFEQGNIRDSHVGASISSFGRTPLMTAKAALGGRKQGSSNPLTTMRQSQNQHIAKFGCN